MSRIIKKIICGICLWSIFCLGAMAETLTYRSTLNQAIDNSFDLKMSSLDIDISKAELKVARADLFPIISTQVNAERNNGLGSMAAYNYAGNTVISSYNQYRNLAYVTLSYNLFDFGAVGKKILIAKKDVDQKAVMLDLRLKDLKLKVLETYTKILQYNDEIKTKTEILKVYEEMFKAKERLFIAGTSDRISVMDEAVKIARTQDDIHNSELELRKALSDLSAITLQKYNPNNLEVLDFDELNIESNIKPVKYFEPLQAKVAEENLDLSFDPYNSLESKYYDFEIEKKKAELDMYKRQRLPAFKFYTNYGLYGSDPNQYFTSLSDLQQRSLTIGISGTFMIFDGFKNKATKEKANLEIKRLELEKEKKLTELKAEYEKTYASYQTYTEELISKKNLQKTITEKLNALDRMFAGGLIEREKLLVAKADLLTQENDLQKNIIDISSKIKQIQIMSGKDL